MGVTTQMETNETFSNNSVTVDAALEAVINFFKGRADLVDVIGRALRQSFDEVIDGPRTGRYRIEELEKTEKTYIGTKVEIILRNELALPRGSVLDNLIAGHEVDTKFSLSGNWMIPREAVGQICLLVEGSDNAGTFSVGLLRMVPLVLTNGANQDGKKSVSAVGKTSIQWLIRNEVLPPNFLLRLPDDVRSRIMSRSSGVQRVKELFVSVTDVIIPRTAIEQVARQKDPLKRARAMKAALAADGFKVLCATYETDREEFRRNGFDEFQKDDWLSLRQAD
jgi:hypothetical protein